MNTPVSQVVNMLTASIAPVIVISGVGLLLRSMTNRYGRVIDRARDLARELEAAGEPPRRAILVEEVAITYRRARMLRHAIILSSTSILFVVVAVLSLFGEQVTGTVDHLAVPAFALCLLCLLGSIYFFIRDVSISLNALELEFAPYRKQS